MSSSSSEKTSVMFKSFGEMSADESREAPASKVGKEREKERENKRQSSHSL